jgi:DNA polymerase (family 10)
LRNKEIIQALKLTASLLELYGENQFKVRSYQTAVYNLERTDQELDQLNQKQLSELPGVGKSIAATIGELQLTGESATLKNLLKQTPDGILELIKVKGIGTKKIKTVWDHLGVESAEQLFTAGKQGLLASLPGFGVKTQERILQVVSFHMANRGLIHYKDAHLQGLNFEHQVREKFNNPLISRVGEFRRKIEVIKSLQYLWATEHIDPVIEFLNVQSNLKYNNKSSGPLKWVGEIIDSSVKLDIRFCSPEEFGSKLSYYTGSPKHLLITNEQGMSLKNIISKPYADEEQVYKALGWPLIIPELREGLYEKEFLKGTTLDNILNPDDVRGILHNHSTYSDGKNSLSEMAIACKELGYQYFGISDHSKTAVYANGLDEEKVAQQQKEIDHLNIELHPFKVFKGIESDILNDGSLDYPDAILQTFDFVVASVHFNLNMDQQQATKRLIAAIENPFTTILGHPTGRLLLEREGYPIDHKKVIDACAKNQVAIEINAHPYRLDLDWRWVRYASNQGVLISVNPDAHTTTGLEDVYYGVCIARKAGLSKEMTLNAMNLEEISQYLSNRNSRITAKAEA